MLGHHASNPSLCLLHRGRSSHYHCSIVMKHAEESLNLYQHVPIVSNKWASPRDILVAIWGCAPPLKLVKVDLGICKDRALGTCHWRCDGSPWAVKTGRKGRVERAERVELVEPTGTGRNSPRKGCEPTKYEDI